MGRLWVESRLVTLTCCGCVLLAACGSKHPNTCASVVGPQDASANGDDATATLIIGGMVTNCPLADSLSITPNELDVGQGGVAVLAASATVADEGMPDFSWSAPSGILGQPSSATTTFQCTTAGDVTITLTVSYDGCQNQISGDILCLGDGG